jgi:Lysyl oxidase
MRLTPWNRRCGVLAVAGLIATAIAEPTLAASSAARVPGPVVRLVAAQRSITLDSFGGQVFLDPGVWVAALGSPLEFDVQRAAYTSPLTITQIIHPPFGGTVRRPLPARLLDGWNGLRRFVMLTVRNSAGKVIVTEPVTFCPNSDDPQRATPGGPPTTPYPTQCASDPFQRAMVWGIQKGWAVDPTGSFLPFSRLVKLRLGVYQVTESISPAYAQLFRISARDATATVKVTVVKGKCCPIPGCCGPPGARRFGQTGSLRRAPAGPTLPNPPRSALPWSGGGYSNVAGTVPPLPNPPRSALPDLVALPAWLIEVSHPRKQTHDFLDFGATVWIGGNGPLDVEGFRSNGSPIMKAYQYFWRNGHVIGRARAGTMGFDSAKGHNHWHFQQFARYALLSKAKSVAVRSHKVGFCIAPTDPVDLLLPHAVWQPSSTRLAGQCGSPTTLSPTTLWVAEKLPLGWGDTYIQDLAGQSFDITQVPNGTYYIEVIANPEKVLYETTTRNDISYRKIILGGTPGHRTVKVPAWHGIDREP